MYIYICYWTDIFEFFSFLSFHFTKYFSFHLGFKMYSYIYICNSFVIWKISPLIYDPFSLLMF